MSAHHPSEDPLAGIQTRAFRIIETDLDPGCREIRVEGELDLAVADQLRARLDMAIEKRMEILIRLDRCDFIDSSGIAVIVIAHRELKKEDRRLAICDPSRPVARTLEITGLGDHVPVHFSGEAAANGRGGLAAASSGRPAKY